VRAVIVRLFVMGLSWLAISPSNVKAEKMAQLGGAVTDTNGAVIADAKLTIVARGHKTNVRTSPDGNYLASLKPGKYRVTAFHEGFCPAKRGQLILEAASVSTVDFVLVVCPRIHQMKTPEVGRVTGEYEAYKDPYNAREIKLPDLEIQPLILFGDERKTDHEIEYTGPAVQGKTLPVIFTFNLLTVRSETITQTSDWRVWVSKGNVVWHDGRRLHKDSMVTITVNGLQPIVSSESATAKR
jgi:hypothetical protein